MLTRCVCLFVVGAVAFNDFAEATFHLRRELDVESEPNYLDLSQPFQRSPSYNQSPCARKVIELAAKEPEIKGLMVLEHGQVVTEYYAAGQNSRTKSPVWSCTKTFTALLLGILVRDGYLF